MYNYKNKGGNIHTLNQYMLNRTLNMFEWHGLPDTVPSDILENFLQTNGYVFWYKWNDEIYIFKASLGGELDHYGRPTKVNIVNQALDIQKTVDIDDGVLMKNDNQTLGLLPIFTKYNSLLTENEITMFIHTINTRIPTLISATDDRTKQSAEIYFKRVEEGELSVIGESAIFDSLKTQPNATNGVNTTSGLIELNQYIKASLYNELGINANYNMKRERLNTSETEMNDDGLRPLVDEMERSRKQAIELINEKFDLNISVEFGSIWKIREVEDFDPVEEPSTESPSGVALDEPFDEPIDEPTDVPSIKDEEEEETENEPIDEPTNEEDQDDQDDQEDQDDQDDQEDQDEEEDQEDQDEEEDQDEDEKKRKGDKK